MLPSLFSNNKISLAISSLVLCSTLSGRAQVGSPAAEGPSRRPFQLPQLLEGGGEMGIVRAIQLGVKYPQQALRDGAQGQSMVTFAVSPTGKVCQVKIKYGIRPDMDTAVVRAVRHLPQLQPAMQHGQAVACLFSAPVTFFIDNPKRLPKQPLPPIDSTQVYTAVTRMPIYKGKLGYRQIADELRDEYLKLAQPNGCFVPRYGLSVIVTVGPSGTIHNLQRVQSDENEKATLEAQFGDQVAKQEEDAEAELPEACLGQLAEAARHLPRLTPAYVDGHPVAMRLLLSLFNPHP